MTGSIYIYTLDVSVISTGFAQLDDEGKIDKKIKPIINLALSRQILWAQFQSNWIHSQEYIYNLNVLLKILKLA